MYLYVAFFIWLTLFNWYPFSLHELPVCLRILVACELAADFTGVEFDRFVTLKAPSVEVREIEVYLV